MKQQHILRWQLAILSLQHGEQAILASLADLRGQTPDELESMLSELEKVGQVPTKRPPTAKNTGFSIDAVLKEHPAKAELIRALKTRYENRTILTELKDVRRFLERHAQPTKSLKARSEAFPKVVQVLVGLPIGELEALLASAPSNEFSGLGVISDQILGRK